MGRSNSVKNFPFICFSICPLQHSLLLLYHQSYWGFWGSSFKYMVVSCKGKKMPYSVEENVEDEARTALTFSFWSPICSDQWVLSLLKNIYLTNWYHEGKFWVDISLRAYWHEPQTEKKNMLKFANSNKFNAVSCSFFYFVTELLSVKTFWK